MYREEKEMIATLGCVKQKDGELFRDACFQMSVEQLGKDADGDDITSLVARHLGTEAEVQQARQSERASGRGGRSSSLMDLVENGMPERSLRKSFYDLLEGLPPEAVKKAYYRARKVAVDGNLIEVKEGLVLDLRKASNAAP